MLGSFIKTAEHIPFGEQVLWFFCSICAQSSICAVKCLKTTSWMILSTVVNWNWVTSCYYVTVPPIGRQARASQLHYKLEVHNFSARSCTGEEFSRRNFHFFVWNPAWLVRSLVEAHGCWWRSWNLRSYDYMLVFDRASSLFGLPANLLLPVLRCRKNAMLQYAGRQHKEAASFASTTALAVDRGWLHPERFMYINILFVPVCLAKEQTRCRLQPRFFSCFSESLLFCR